MGFFGLILEREERREGGKEAERNWLVFYLFIHSLVDACM